LFNPQIRKSANDLNNPYDMHRTIMRAFPFTIPEGERVLFRLEENSISDYSADVVLVQSTIQPDWNFLNQRQGVSLHGEVKDISGLTFHAGGIYQFSLYANPVVTPFVQGKSRGKRVAITNPDEQIAWLERKGTQSGFKLHNATTSPVSNKWILKPRGEGKPRNKITIHRVAYSGALTVTDPEKFRATITKGIGRGKGFGCGMMVMKPL
jgi:CRISPR system Cascade subunit CasE